MTELPPIDAFYSSLSEETITPEAYDRAQNVWRAFGIENMHKYHDLYLNSDVLLLVNVFENFRQTCILDYGLDPAHYYTLPGFTFDACLKFTEQGLALFTDSEKFIFIENSIRGGISVVSYRHVKANNPPVPDYDHNSPHTYLTYLDANNLYGGAMSEALPIGDFTFVTEEEVASFDPDATTKSDDYGYILEIDLKYREHLHDLHSDYPLVAEKFRIRKEMLSAFSYSLISKHVTSEKLSSNLYVKTKYVVHYENLRFYLKHRLQLVKVHRILKFK